MIAETVRLWIERNLDHDGYVFENGKHDPGLVFGAVIVVANDTHQFGLPTCIVESVDLQLVPVEQVVAHRSVVAAARCALGCPIGGALPLALSMTTPWYTEHIGGHIFSLGLGQVGGWALLGVSLSLVGLGLDLILNETDNRTHSRPASAKQAAAGLACAGGLVTFFHTQSFDAYDTVYSGPKLALLGSVVIALAMVVRASGIDQNIAEIDVERTSQLEERDRQGDGGWLIKSEIEWS